ncbi:MAG TPA: hypothetical protein PKB14_22125 [Rubrivivax sp.]|nr:hypothetical protein [Rubrivivax sp.]
MPTLDRKPRARRMPEAAPDTPLTILQAMYAAGNDDAAWAALRPRAVRFYAARGMTPEQAARIFDAYRKKPMYLPLLPPLDRL